MKVLIMINNLAMGGAERLVVDDINEMLRRGIDVKLITLKLEKEKSLSPQCKIAPEQWIRIDFGSFLNLKSWFKVIKQINLFKPDVLIAHLWYSNVIGRIAGKICRIKNIIIFEHNVYDTLKTKKMFFIDKWLQSFSDHIVAVSQAVKDSLLRHDIADKKIKVILNGIDISKYLKPPENDIKKELGLEDKFVFIFIGRLIYQKGVDILLRAFQKVAEKTDKTSLLIVGEGDKKEELVGLSRELVIDGKVHFLGLREDIVDLLLGSDCFVLPSRYEGLPMVLLEAVAARKPIIASDFDSASEIIQNNKNGIIIPKEDPDQLAEAMASVFSDAAYRSKLEGNLESLSRAVSVENHIDKVLSLIR